MPFNMPSSALLLHEINFPLDHFSTIFDMECFSLVHWFTCEHPNAHSIVEFLATRQHSNVVNSELLKVVGEGICIFGHAVNVWTDNGQWAQPFGCCKLPTLWCYSPNPLQCHPSYFPFGFYRGQTQISGYI